MRSDDKHDLKAMAQEHAGRGDDCGRLARLVLEHLSAERAQMDSIRLVDALRGMVGLVQLVQERYPDFPVDNHRVIEAMSALAATDAAPQVVTEEMVNRFLSWNLPKDFSPDCGISFKPPQTPHPIGYWPIGTNLFTADQAKAMLEHVLGGHASAIRDAADVV